MGYQTQLSQLASTITLTGLGAGSSPVTYVAQLADGSGWIGHLRLWGCFIYQYNRPYSGTTIPTKPTPLYCLPCFTHGTMILTPDGEQPVEALRPGQLVVTQVDGVAIPRAVKWVGHRRIDLTRHPRAEIMAPIRIERDAFADNMPHRDLLVSQDHAIFVDGVLICAKQLVNGTTIRRERDWTAVDYYHVELDQHAILLAEGLPAESYLNTGNRGFFANSGQPMVLHPELTDETAYPTREADSCVPFVWDGASVQPVWQRLAERAAAIGQPVPQRVTTTDADLQLMLQGRMIKPIYGDDKLVIFTLPPSADEVRLVSRAQPPTEARPWLGDQRRARRARGAACIAQPGRSARGAGGPPGPGERLVGGRARRAGDQSLDRRQSGAVAALDARSRDAGGPPRRDDDLRRGGRAGGSGRAARCLINLHKDRKGPAHSPAPFHLTSAASVEAIVWRPSKA